MKMFSISKKQSVFNFQAQGYINVYIYIYTWICEANKLSTTEYLDQPARWFVSYFNYDVRKIQWGGFVENFKPRGIFMG